MARLGPRKSPQSAWDPLRAGVPALLDVSRATAVSLVPTPRAVRATSEAGRGHPLRTQLWGQEPGVLQARQRQDRAGTCCFGGTMDSFWPGNWEAGLGGVGPHVTWLDPTLLLALSHLPPCRGAPRFRLRVLTQVPGTPGVGAAGPARDRQTHSSEVLRFHLASFPTYHTKPPATGSRPEAPPGLRKPGASPKGVARAGFPWKALRSVALVPGPWPAAPPSGGYF